MLVKAKCVMKAFESNACLMFEPGCGPLPGGLYEIERDGPLASMKVGNIDVFQFDRNAGPDDKPHDYTCKKLVDGEECGKKCKNLAELGNHVNKMHKEAAEIPVDDEPVVVREDGRKKPRTFTCKECGEILPHLYALKVHKKTHEVAVAVAA